MYPDWLVPLGPGVLLREDCVRSIYTAVDGGLPQGEMTFDNPNPHPALSRK